MRDLTGVTFRMPEGQERACPACGDPMDRRRRICRACWAILPLTTKQRIDAARTAFNAGRMARRDYSGILAAAVAEAAELRTPQLSLAI